MKYYLAPLEGITTYIYRRAYQECFQPMDKYFTPFIVPHINKDFNFKEKNELLPENNPEQYLVPQIMTNNAEDFLRTVQSLENMGYKEVNLNLGCPSGTVVSKRRGSGFLADPDALDVFFEEVFKRVKADVSVKTRIGIERPEEFEPILKVYNRYPLKELIIHPRVRKDFYKNQPNLEVFAMACEESRNPLCYNGDLFSVKDVKQFQKRFPQADCVMLGRGILRNPFLIDQIESGREANLQVLRRFHQRIYQDYKELLPGERSTLFRMKEFWSYLVYSFEDREKVWKKVKKTQTLSAYEAVTEEIFMSVLCGQKGITGRP